MLRSRLVALGALGVALACAGPSSEEPAPAEPVVPEREKDTLTYRSLPEGAFFTPWEAGDVLSLGVDGANLRAEASTESKVLGLLSMGRRVTIEAIASPALTLIERQNRWYQVKTERGEQGFLFGALLTPVVLEENLDGDPGSEWIAVTFSPNYVPRVRVMEPSFDAKDDRVVALDLPMAAGGRGGRIRAEVLPGQKTAWKVVHVELCGDDGCTSQLVAYLLPRPDVLGYLSSVEARPEQVTFTDEGFTLAGEKDPFISARGLLSNGPCTDCDQLLVARYDEPKVVLDHQYPGERDVGPRIVCETVGRIKDGWYQGKELVSCNGDSLVLVAHPDHWLLISEDTSHTARLVTEQGVRIHQGERWRVVFDETGSG
jgi:hypothetical protein